jgi:hypothetical protein
MPMVQSWCKPSITLEAVGTSYHGRIQTMLQMFDTINALKPTH